jgi:16S rRNA (cytosine967-C5)-methyltransferase
MSGGEDRGGRGRSGAPPGRRGGPTGGFRKGGGPRGPRPGGDRASKDRPAAGRPGKGGPGNDKSKGKPHDRPKGAFGKGGDRPDAKRAGAPRPKAPTGFGTRQLAVHLIKSVLSHGQSLDEALVYAFTREDNRGLPSRDRAFARLIAATVLRRHGQLEAAIAAFLERPLPADRGVLSPILLAAAAQLLFLDTPAHAALNIAVEQCRRDAGAHRFDRLANAVLRRVATQGPALVAAQDAAALNMPDWLWQRWIKTYGEANARQIALGSLREAALDVSVKADAAHWAERLGGRVLPTGSVRLAADGKIEDLAGYAEGAWWVQDAAATLPARLLGDVRGLVVADLCAAPGGKTAQLAAAGARVTAVDVSSERLARLRSNLMRLSLPADIVIADAATWSPSTVFDAVLLDAPCTATGTIRRHPDILRLKRPGDAAKLAEQQGRLLRNAVRLVKPGGLVVYCTCSLEREEGEEQVGRFLAASGGVTRVPVAPDEVGGTPDWITPAGDLRTLPHHLPWEPPEQSGLDGFYAARLKVAE